MDKTIKKLYTDPPFALQFEALNEDGQVIDANGPLVITPLQLSATNEVVAKAVVRESTCIIDFTLTGKPGRQEFTVSDGLARAGLLLIVHSIVEVDARLVPVDAVLADAPAPQIADQSTEHEGVTNAK
jgi:hypothetical protein